MEKLSQDIDLLQKDYSSYRCGNKWRSYRAPYIPGQDFSEDPKYLKVIRSSLSVIDYYQIQSLTKRNQLKKSPSIFSEYQKLWQNINPGNLRGISKSLYTVVVEAFYKQFQQSMANPRIVDVYLSKDAEIDFQSRSSLTFAEFYDILFEILDSLARSTLASEYARLIFTTRNIIVASPQFASLNLYSKLHLSDNARPIMYGWMHQYIRNLTPIKNLTQLPEIVKNSSTISIAPKFLARVSNKTVKETLPIKWDLQKYLLERKEKSPLRALTPTLASLNSNESNRKVGKKSVPLSVTPLKVRKETFLIEDVVEERVGRKLNALI